MHTFTHTYTFARTISLFASLSFFSNSIIIYVYVCACVSAGVKNSFLLSMLECLQYLMLTCNQYCIICDRKLNYAGLKPSLCDSALCNFRCATLMLCCVFVSCSYGCMYVCLCLSLCIASYEQYGLGSDIAAEVRYNPEVIYLLITLAVACCKGIHLHFSLTFSLCVLFWFVLL